MSFPKSTLALPKLLSRRSSYERSTDHLVGDGPRIANQLKVYRPFTEARAFARSLKLGSQKEWQAFCKGQLPEKGQLPSDIPAKPDSTYADKGWKGYGDWLGAV